MVWFPTRTTWALGALIALAYLPVLIGGQTFADAGWLGDVLPSRYAAGEAIAGGHLPGWWHEAGFGVPLAAEPDHAALYPPTWLAAFGGHALDVVALAHLWLLAVGTAALARRLGADVAGGLLAGAAAALSAIAAGSLVGGHLFAIAWVPLAGARALALADAVVHARLHRAPPGGGTRPSSHDRVAHAWLAHAPVRDALLVAACLAACKLAGTATINDAAMFTVVVAGAARAGVRGALWGAAACLAGLLLAAVQIAPMLMHAASGHSAGASWSAPGAALLDVLAPGATGDTGRLFGGGAAIIALAALAHTRWLALPVALLLFAQLRPPVAAIAWVWFAALAGAGLTSLTRDPPTRDTWIRAAAIVGGLATALVALVLARQSIAAAVDDAGLDGVAIVEHAQRRGLVALAFAVAAVGLALHAGRRALPPLAALAALLALVEVALSGRTAVPRRDRDAAVGPMIAALERHAPIRVFRNDAAGTARTDSIAAVGDPAERLEQATRRAARSSAAPRGIAAIPGRDPARLAIEDRLPAATASAASRLLDRYAISVAIVPATVVTAAGFTTVASEGDLALVTTEPQRPHAFWVTNWRHADDDAVLAAFAPPPGDTGEPLGTVLLAGKGDAGGEALAARPRPCAFDRPHAAEVRMRCAISAPGYAVLLDAWAPGWTATVDGRDVPVERADLIARAVRVAPRDPPELQVIVFRYTTPGLALGAAISALALLNAALLLWITRR